MFLDIQVWKQVSLSQYLKPKVKRNILQAEILRIGKNTFQKYIQIKYTGCSKKKDWAITQLKKVFGGCIRVHLNHKYPTFDKMHQGSQVDISL